LTHVATPRNFGQPLCAVPVVLPEEQVTAPEWDNDRMTPPETCITGRPEMTFPTVGE